MDTLDYSSTGEINEGSKVVCAAVGEKKRELCKDLSNLSLDDGLKPHLVMPGVLVVESEDVESVKSKLEHLELEGIALITLVDDSAFVAEDISNWLWVTFTRSNPAEDIFGLEEEIQNKHWHCRIPIIDARVSLIMLQLCTCLMKLCKWHIKRLTTHYEKKDITSRFWRIR